jgi:hypothetical protein
VAAAKLLGWKVTQLSTPLTPEGYQSTINQIVQSLTDFAVITALVPGAAVTSQFTALANAGTKIVELAPSGTSPSAAGPVYGVVVGKPLLSLSGKPMGDAVVADSGGNAKTPFVWDPSTAALFDPVKKSYSDAVEGQVVSYLQSHPDVTYMAFSLSDEATGVPQAIAAAGLSGKVKVVSRHLARSRWRMSRAVLSGPRSARRTPRAGTGRSTSWRALRRESIWATCATQWAGTRSSPRPTSSTPTLRPTPPVSRRRF